MSRLHTSLLFSSTLVVGLTSGIALDRGLLLSTLDSQTPQVKAAPLAQDSQASTPLNGDEAIYETLSEQYNHFQQVNRTFELVSTVVSKSVVHLVARKPRSNPNGRTRDAYYEESGSGVIIRPSRRNELFVLTNNHVIDGAEPENIRISLQDGRIIRPERIWSDNQSDVAILRLKQQDLPFARLGDSDDVSVGTWVLAIGSPFGLTHSVSQGIISARGRHERDLLDSGVVNQDFLQTDAAINPGNSGGPLVNLKGEVIGINTAIASQGGGNEGVGYSIPINLAKWVMDQLIEHGKVRRGAMGVQLGDVPPDDAEDLGLDRPCGTRILKVSKDSPAAQGGIQEGDLVVSYNGILVLDTNHFINMVAMTPIGQPADLVILRAGRQVHAKVVVADREATLALMPAEPETNTDSSGLLRRPNRPDSSPDSSRTPTPPRYHP